MSRLPIPGSDDDIWGNILNDYLDVSLNSDGTLQTGAIQHAGGVTNINGATTSNGTITLTAADVGAFALPIGGIPLSDLDASLQTSLSNAADAVQLAGDLGGTTASPMVVELQGIDLDATTPADGQVLTYNATNDQWVPASVSSGGVSDATTTNKGILQLDGDLGGNAASPTVVNTSLTAPLPVDQGGTGSDVQNFVDLTSNQLIAGTKTLSGTLSTVDLKVTGGSPASGKVLTSDSSGNATWQSTGATTLASDSDVSISSPANGQVLTYNSTASKWENESSSTPGNATSSTPGLIQLDGDLGGNAASPTVVNTSLTAPLPVDQGGTGSTTQNFVDLSSSQTIAGGKSFTGEVTVQDPVNPTDVANKEYVDSTASGLDPKASVEAATSGVLPTNTYNNGASGVGATLTATTNGTLTIDGYSVSTNNRVLVQNEAAAANNGIYVVTSTGSGSSAYVLTRSSDFDTSSQVPGAYVFVQNGTVNADSGFVCTNTGTTTFGTTSITWTQFSSSTQIAAGSGLTKTGNVMSVTAPLTVNLGGTGSTTQNFVDLSSNQTAAGNKTFTGTTTTSTLDSTSVNTQTLQVTGGSPASGKVLTSDSSGNATWQSTGATTLASDSDVSISSPANGQVLTYNSTASKWENESLGAEEALSPTAIKTSAYTASPGDFVPVDTSSGSVIITLPTAPADKSRIGIKMINSSGSNTVTFNCGGSDVFNKAGGAATGILSLLNQAVIIQYAATPAIWYVQDDDLPLSQLDGRYLEANGVSISGTPSTSGQALVSTSSSAAGWTTLSYNFTQTWTVAGYVNVAQGDVDYINPIFVSSPSPQTLRLISCWYVIHSDPSSSATVGIYQNGSLVGSFSNIVVTTTKGSTTPGTPLVLNDGDMLQLVVASVNNTPLNMSFSMVLQASI